MKKKANHYVVGNTVKEKQNLCKNSPSPQDFKRV